jgi:hypothetical protein
LRENHVNWIRVRPPLSLTHFATKDAAAWPDIISAITRNGGCQSQETTLLLHGQSCERKYCTLFFNKCFDRRWGGFCRPKPCVPFSTRKFGDYEKQLKGHKSYMTEKCVEMCGVTGTVPTEVTPSDFKSHLVAYK